jgi:serine-type D-Ala-D-Ala carboxypeptidase (penicillin-binding protein 5/6)
MNPGEREALGRPRSSPCRTTWVRYVAACDVVGERSSSARYLHFKTKPKRRFPRRAALLALVVVVIVAGAVAIRAATESTPALTVQRRLATSVALTGAQPRLAWPATGEAAVEVEGMPPLGSSGPEQPRPIASLAKIMTALVVLRDHPLSTDQSGFRLSVSPADVADYQSRAAQQESVVAVTQGETLDELQLLQALLVASGNNIAVILAQYDAGSTNAFVAKMNSTAQELGMTHTTYTDPSGLAPTTVSTASDQMILAARAMAIPVFARVVAMRSVSLPVAGTIANFDTAVGTSGFVGVKTGSDAESGGCLVFASNQTVSGHTITVLGAVLGQAAGQPDTATLTTAALSAATALVHSVTASMALHTALPAGTVVAVVSNSSGAKVGVATSQALTAFGYAGLNVPLSMTVSPLGSHLSAGQTVATVTASTGTDQTTPATASSSLPGPTLKWRLSHLF